MLESYQLQRNKARIEFMEVKDQSIVQTNMDINVKLATDNISVGCILLSMVVSNFIRIDRVY